MPLAVEIWQVPLPLPRRILTPAGPFDTYYHLVVVLSDGDQAGWGYGATASASQLQEAASEVVRLLSARPLTLASAITVEHFARTAGHPPPAPATRAAVSAVAIAAWDLAARRLGVGCADLWGRRMAGDGIAGYGSGFFLDSTVADLEREAEDLRGRHFRLVKMRTGLTLDEDVARFRAIEPFFPEPATIAVDAVCSWTPAQALAFVDRVGTPLLWVEDATTYERMAEVAGAAAPLAAGESLGSLAELAGLRSRARLDYALLDVQALGGPAAFLGAAHVLTAQGARVAAHIFTPVSAHLLACVDDPGPLEVFDWSDPLMVEPPQPDAGGLIPVSGPGFGVELRRDTLHTYGGEPVTL